MTVTLCSDHRALYVSCDGQSVSQSVSLSVSQSVSLSVSQSVSLAVSQSVRRIFSRPNRRRAGQLLQHTAVQLGGHEY